MDRPIRGTGGHLLTGAAAGMAATAPMTLVMELLHATLPRRERYPLPPQRITNKAADKAGVGDKLDPASLRSLSMFAHFGYGAAAGAIFGKLAPRNTPEAVAGGVGFGLLVWAVSYLGLLPALGLHEPATREPARRNALMIAAHVVWGGLVGGLADRFRR